MDKGTIAFVPPRYGRKVVGGAETHAGMLAEELHHRGWPVEILTTCAEDPHSWRGEYEPGEEFIGGIKVRRFPQESRKYTRRVFRTEQRIIAGKKVSLAKQRFWIGNVVTSRALCDYLDRRREDYRAFVFIPYLFGTTYQGIETVPERSYIIPCLHDEPYAYQEVFRRMMRSVRGIMFNTPPEMELAKRLYGDDLRGEVVGGVAYEPYSADGDRFRAKYGISGDFVLYSGRREIFKNTFLLLRYFCNYLQNTDREVSLVLIGSGAIEIPFSFRNRVIDLGFVSERDKRDAYDAATIVCQPSERESLSLVLLEAWLTGVPALVHGDCAVTRYHVERCGGGLWFTDYPTFHEALDYLLDRPALREEMGLMGRDYIMENYNWDRIVERFSAVLEEGERGAL